ncbi:hypothetical protein LEMLEM_LOCUS24092, partial [Lemmus lemmus]
ANVILCKASEEFDLDGAGKDTVPTSRGRPRLQSPGCPRMHSVMTDFKKLACLYLESAGIKGLHHQHPAAASGIN